jgi:hypothetical protein
MSQFIVDSRSLLTVRDTLGRLHDQLLGMHTVIYGYWGALGGRELEGELEHFCGTWHYGVTEVAGEVTHLMGGLAGAAAAYERIEDRVRAAGASGHGAAGASGHGAGQTHSSGGAALAPAGHSAPSRRPAPARHSAPPRHVARHPGTAQSGGVAIGGVGRRAPGPCPGPGPGPGRR